MEVFLKIGELAVQGEGDVIKTVLGSCIGLCLWDRESRTGGVVHIMLPDGRDEEKRQQPGKYASTAVVALREAVLRQTGRPESLVAKITGGASMFFGQNGAATILMVGKQNYDIVRRKLDEIGIPVAFEHIEGRKGRNISFDCGTGSLTVRVQDGNTITG